MLLEYFSSSFKSFNLFTSFLIFRCHGPKPPPKPEFTLKPKKKKGFHPEEPTPGSLCPPCPELLWTPCVGQHISAERMVRARFQQSLDFNLNTFLQVSFELTSVIRGLVLVHFCSSNCFFFFLLRWFAQVGHNFLVIICVEILFPVPIIIVQKFATH